MPILYILIGVVIGFGGKIFADKYSEWKQQEKENSEKLENWLTELKAVELLKNEALQSPTTANLKNNLKNI